MNKTELKNASIDSIESMADFYEKTADEIWENPELSLKEYKAAALYCRILREHGFDVREKLCGIDTAFCGSFGSGRPYIGILGEFDALSGLSQKAGSCEKDPVVQDGDGHGCGHNLLGVGSLAAAFAVKKYLQDSGSSGTVIFFGCPGEEGGSGKAFMAREKVWEKLDAGIRRMLIRSKPARITRRSRCCTNLKALRLTRRNVRSLGEVRSTQLSL